MSFGSGARPTGGGDDGTPRLPLAGVTLGVGIVVGVAIGFALWRAGGSGGERGEVNPRPAPSTVRQDVVPSVERQLAQRRLAAFSGESFDPASPPDAAPSGFVAPVRLRPPYTAIDATVFDTCDGRVKLADVWPVGRHEVCMGPGAIRFACGLMGRATLQNFIAGRDVVCRPQFRVSSTEERPPLVADCSVDGKDLGTHMVEVGFAFPSGEERSDRRRALDGARSAGRGVWAGDYDRPDHDRALDDMAANPPEAIAQPEVGAGVAEPPPPRPLPVDAPERRAP